MIHLIKLFFRSFCLQPSLFKCACVCMRGVCVQCVCVVCVKLRVSQIRVMPLPAWLTRCGLHAGLSQKGVESGLSIPGCEPQQWLGKAASGSQPITGLPAVLGSSRCMIGPGVAGWGMDRWRNDTSCMWRHVVPVIYYFYMSKLCIVNNIFAACLYLTNYSACTHLKRQGE